MTAIIGMWASCKPKFLIRMEGNNVSLLEYCLGFLPTIAFSIIACVALRKGWFSYTTPFVRKLEKADIDVANKVASVVLPIMIILIKVPNVLLDYKEYYGYSPSTAMTMLLRTGIPAAMILGAFVITDLVIRRVVKSKKENISQPNTL